MRRFAILLLGAGAALGVWLLVLRTAERPPPASGDAPEAIEPYGIVSRDELVFSWAPIGGGTPTRVEVLDIDRRPLWRSPSVNGTRLLPREEEVEALPDGDLYWRPVAEPDVGPERPGALAAFTLR